MPESIDLSLTSLVATCGNGRELYSLIAEIPLNAPTSSGTRIAGTTTVGCEGTDNGTAIAHTSTTVADLSTSPCTIEG
ncbi:MAG: hypothetical protein LH477_09125, partial [Nocardioides sp.]|nr:hypothetical protein [Nocardioides sp.]